MQAERTSRAVVRKRRPAEVGVIAFGVRCRSFTPSSSSSLAMDADRAGWDTAARIAALVKLPVSAIATKCRIWYSSILINPIYGDDQNKRFYLSCHPPYPFCKTALSVDHPAG